MVLSGDDRPSSCQDSASYYSDEEFERSDSQFSSPEYDEEDSSILINAEDISKYTIKECMPSR
jgi:hypothetical protein